MQLNKVKRMVGKLLGKTYTRVGVEDVIFVTSLYTANEREWKNAAANDIKLKNLNLLVEARLDETDLPYDAITQFEWGVPDTIAFLFEEYPELSEALIKKWFYWFSLVR